MSQHLSFQWNDHMNLLVELQNFLSYDVMVDVTLACDGQNIKAHKLILSACSPFFKNLFLENPCPHPIVILKDVKYQELEAIIDFMYHGHMEVPSDMLPSLLKTAQTLRVKGLEKVMDMDSNYDSVTEGYGNQSVDQLVNEESEDDEPGVYEPEIKQEMFSDDGNIETNSSALFVPSKSPVSSKNATNSLLDSQRAEPNFLGLIPVEESHHISDLSSESCGPPAIEQPHCSKDYNSDLGSVKPEIVASVENLQTKTRPASCSKMKSKVKSRKSSVLKMKDFLKIRKSPYFSILMGSKKKLKTTSILKRYKQQNKPENKGGDPHPENVKISENSNSLIPKLKIKRSTANGRFQTASSKKLKKHTNTVRERKKFLCDYDQCKYFSHFKNNLERHIAVVHKNEKPYCCLMCPYKTAIFYDLKRHHSKKHASQAKSDMCAEGDIIASEKTEVKSQTINHGNENLVEATDLQVNNEWSLFGSSLSSSSSSN